MRGGSGEPPAVNVSIPEAAAKRWGTPPWSLHARIPAARLPPSCDLAVVGAGVTGLACGAVAARRGLRVVVLEAAKVGAGASGRTGGIVLEETAAGPLEGVTACIPALERILRELRIQCDLGLGKCWELAHRRGREPAVPGWTDGGERLVVREVVPGGTIDPGSLLTGLARAVLDAGGIIAEGSAVRAFRSGPRTALDLARGSLTAGHVVLAMNAYTKGLAPEIEDVRAALTLAICTEPLDPETIASIGLRGGTPFYTADLPYLWGRPLADGRLIFGSGLAFDPSGDLSRIQIREGDAAAALASLEARVRGLHPKLAGVRVATRWGGPVAFSRDRRPILAPLARAPRVLVTGAYAGHGIALGVRIGELVADWAAGVGELPAWSQPLQR
jgi:glycine/D-amino acid oxidase-like deaminating enzyme